MEKEMVFQEDIVEAQKKGQRVLDCAGCGRTEVKQENHHLLCRHCNKMATEKDRDRLYLLLTGKERVKQNSRKERWGVPTKEIHDAIRDSFTEDATRAIIGGEDPEVIMVKLPVAFPDLFGKANVYLADNPIPLKVRRSWVEFASLQVKQRAEYFSGAVAAIKKFLETRGNNYEGSASKLATEVLHSENRPEYPHSVLTAAAQVAMDEMGITDAQKTAYFEKARRRVQNYLEEHPGLDVSGPVDLANLILSAPRAEHCNHRVMTKAAAMVMDQTGINARRKEKEEASIKRLQQLCRGAVPGAGPNANKGLDNRGATARNREKNRERDDRRDALAREQSLANKGNGHKKGAKRAHG